MITLFRRIRQKLIDSGSVTKYLFYAAGEILLVVFGILIALQLNNWNEERKKVNTVENVLDQIAKDLDRNLYDMKGDIIVHRLGYQSNLKITQALLDKAPYSEEMAFDFWFLKEDEYIFPITTGYDKLKELGVSSVNNPELEQQLLQIYEAIMPRISIDSCFNPDMSEYFSGYYSKNFRYNTDLDLSYEIIIDQDTIRFPKMIYTPYGEELIIRGYIPLDYDKLVNDDEFMILLKESFDFRRYKLGRYTGLVRATEEAIAMIRKKLESTPLSE